jgi:hypothetical protein
MTDLLAAAKEICDWLDERRIRSCIIGAVKDGMRDRRKPDDLAITPEQAPPRLG